MKSTIIVLACTFGILTLGGCDHSPNGASEGGSLNDTSENSNKVMKFDREIDYVTKTLAPGVFMKEMNAAVGGQIEMGEFSIYRRDPTAWEKGGKLLVVNDDTMGPVTHVECALPPEQGDKVMNRMRMGPVAIKGTIASFSSTSGLRIDPCIITQGDLN